MDIYTRLTYDQYKDLERQCKNFDLIETTHTTVEGAYHRSFRLHLGDVVLEFQGPVVKPPLRETHQFQEEMSK